MNVGHENDPGDAVKLKVVVLPLCQKIVTVPANPFDPTVGTEMASPAEVTFVLVDEHPDTVPRTGPGVGAVRLLSVVVELAAGVSEPTPPGSTRG